MSTDHPSSGYSSLSHPVWDEWIEILENINLLGKDKSHPVWDEWIEIKLSNEWSVRVDVSSRLG